MVVNSSVLGYVFIISGIALAILAFGIYFTFRDSLSKKKVTTIEKGEKDEVIPSIEAVEALPNVDSSNESSAGGEDAIIIETPMSQEEVIPSMASNLNEVESPIPDKQELKTVATVLREVDTGNLIIRVDDMEYVKPEELMDSNHWSRIERLSSDLKEWLESTELQTSPFKTSSDLKTGDNQSATPKSMVEEINLILERKLRTEDVDRKAIKIIEMLDGSVKVYIGVDSYPIDEVPFEDVRQLIREAVSEWEGSR